MDFVYFVKQLNHEISLLEAQLAEKKSARDKLAGTLSPQERTMLNLPETESPQKPKPNEIKPQR